MTTKLYGGDKRLYTAAEARRIDKEASKDAERGGRITRGKPFERAIQFDEETLVWGCQLINDFFPISLDSEELLKEQWIPFTAFLNAEQSENPEPEQKPIVLDYLVLVDANERIKQLEKENESLLAERNRLREWYEDYYTKQPTIEQLQEVLQNALDSREDLKKELAEATQNYHEILADHGELTQKFDELTEKARKRECAHELPEREKRIYYFDTPGRLMGHGGYYPAIGCFVLNTLFACVELTDAQVKFWTWKYEADL